MSGRKFLEVQSGYMNRAHDPQEIARALKLLLKHHGKTLEFDTLVGTGLSGTIVVPQIARSLRKKYLIVRKDNDQTHSSYPAEGVLGSKWLFVDDLIASGKTMNRCVKAVNSLCGDHFSWTTELTGVFLYGDGGAGAGVLQNARLKRREQPTWDGFEYSVDRDYSEEGHTCEWELLRELCTGCEHGCEGSKCRGEKCRECYTWCGRTRAECRRALDAERAKRDEEYNQRYRESLYRPPGLNRDTLTWDYTLSFANR